jgi:hypothetical protein
MATLAQQTPGDGEPTIMAFRRPLDRPAVGGKPALAVARDGLPVVLKLPDLARPASTAALAPTIPSPRAWVSMALWLVTGLLGVVAAVVLMIGRPASTQLPDEAPAWDSAAPPAAIGDQAAEFGGANQNGLPYSQPNTGAPGTPVVQYQPPVAAQPATETGLPPWNPTNGQSTDPNAAPGGGPLQPSGNPTGPTGLGDPWPPDAPEPDQTKNLEVHSYRTVARPDAARRDGGARLDGNIRNLETPSSEARR